MCTRQLIKAAKWAVGVFQVCVQWLKVGVDIFNVVMGTQWWGSEDYCKALETALVAVLVYLEC